MNLHCVAVPDGLLRGLEQLTDLCGAWPRCITVTVDCSSLEFTRITALPADMFSGLGQLQSMSE